MHNIIIDNCIDLLKLEGANELMKANVVYYYDLLDFSGVNVKQIYPDNAEWNLYYRENSDLKNKFVTNIPVSLYNPSTKSYSFGILTIETLSK